MFKIVKTFTIEHFYINKNKFLNKYNYFIFNIIWVTKPIYLLLMLTQTVLFTYLNILNMIKL